MSFTSPTEPFIFKEVYVSVEKVNGKLNVQVCDDGKLKSSCDVRARD